MHGFPKGSDNGGEFRRNKSKFLVISFKDTQNPYIRWYGIQRKWVGGWKPLRRLGRFVLQPKGYKIIKSLILLQGFGFLKNIGNNWEVHRNGSHSRIDQAR